jgi:glucose-1-phosphate cytidylyltransferase
VLNYIAGDGTVFEQEPLQRLAQEGQLYNFRHDGFWKCMDTLRDKKMLNEMWDTGHAKWKTWI